MLRYIRTKSNNYLSRVYKKQKETKNETKRPKGSGSKRKGKDEEDESVGSEEQEDDESQSEDIKPRNNINASPLDKIVMEKISKGNKRIFRIERKDDSPSQEGGN